MRLSLALILALLITGCGLLPEVQDETKGWSAQKLYTEAKDQMADGGYEKAIQYFEKLEARYPYGRYAQQAQIEIAYAYYKANEPASALAACDRFIKLHPNHPNVDYIYYLRGLVNFNDDLGFLGALTEKIAETSETLAPLAKQDMSERDPKASREAFESFKELTTRFPDSKYTPDAIARMKYLVNALASHEVHVARYYYKRGAYVAAVNRAQSAMQQFPQAPATEEALTIMVKAYDALGMNDLRDDTLRIMQKNFPNSRFFALQKKAETPWWKIW
ncbi:outer membrane protein assembly factor BamD [Sulfuricella sp.]|uniref:outer membrane protein assembly factor BamD n=1 Tax=Sulfuricella sp. TaxID=2099377 RepID=UPI002BEF7D21|nr:outer membrane protein assembly factor BamD [Sulfuricella sp.]HUX64462.1 outer membrane protein assembly factor BamD [Sulfuricella sp.]